MKIEALKEKGVPFSHEMIRALLDGRKTQTRRIIKDIPSSLVDEKEPWFVAAFLKNCGAPYGPIGRRLWVKETWGFSKKVEKKMQKKYLDQKFSPHTIHFKADNSAPGPIGFDWRTPRFMPRWASRITLEVTDVRVQRIQEISEEDARAEGYRDPGFTPGAGKKWFKRLWHSIHGPDAWERNDWVFAYTFKVVK